jgi:hypothetical protein
MNTNRAILLCAFLAVFGQVASVISGMAEPAAEAADLAFLRDLTRGVVAASRVMPGQKVGGSPTNSCGFTLIMPGGRGGYPAFWIRDFAMSLESGFISADEMLSQPLQLQPTIHACYWPTENVKPGDEITFKVRTFQVRSTEGRERWDFGDGSTTVEVQSDGNVKTLAKDGYAVTTHRYARPGRYLVSVQRSNERGETATGRLQVAVGENP